MNHICVRFVNETNHDALPCFNHVEEIEMGTTLSIDNCIGNHKSKQSTASWHTTSAHTGDDSIYDLNEMQNKLDVGEHHVGTLIVAIKSSRSCGSSNNDSIHHLTISSRIQDTRFNSEGVNHICVRFGNETNHDTLPCFNHVEEIEIGFWGRTETPVYSSPDKQKEQDDLPTMIETARSEKSTRLVTLSGFMGDKIEMLGQEQERVVKEITKQPH